MRRISTVLRISIPARNGKVIHTLLLEKILYSTVLYKQLVNSN